MTDNNSVSAATPSADRATAVEHPPATTVVAHLITATNRTIAEAHQHNRKHPTLRDHLISRLHFAVARRLARLAWSFAMRGKGRVS